MCAGNKCENFWHTLALLKAHPTWVVSIQGRTHSPLNIFLSLNEIVKPWQPVLLVSPPEFPPMWSQAACAAEPLLRVLAGIWTGGITTWPCLLGPLHPASSPFFPEPAPTNLGRLQSHCSVPQNQVLKVTIVIKIARRSLCLFETPLGPEGLCAMTGLPVRSQQAPQAFMCCVSIENSSCFSVNYCYLQLSVLQFPTAEIKDPIFPLCTSAWFKINFSEASLSTSVKLGGIKGKSGYKLFRFYF